MSFTAGWPISYFIFAAAITGLAIGSFLNVVIHRLPGILHAQWQEESRSVLELTPVTPDARISLSRPGSHCPSCKSPVRWRHNIPVISWLILRGRCADCKAGIAGRYPLVELVTATLFCLCVWKFGASAKTLAAMVLCAMLLALTFIDFDARLLPDCLTLPLLWLGLLFNASYAGFVSLQSAVYGAALGYAFLWLICNVFLWITGRQGMGAGDFKLLAALGAWLGLHAIPYLILISSLVGILIGLYFRWRHADPQAPFGPGLAVAGLGIMFALY